MKRLKLLLVVFCITISVPLAYFVFQTYQGLAQQEMATMNYFANTLFDGLEQTLSALVLKEEGRAIDEYNFKMAPAGPSQKPDDSILSPLSRLPSENFILGYFQNNPDGSFQTPLVDGNRSIPRDRKTVIARLQTANRTFNQKRIMDTDRIDLKKVRVRPTGKTEQKVGLAAKYLDLSRSKKTRAYLGQKEKRVESITPGQALNIAKNRQQKETRNQQKADGSQKRMAFRAPAAPDKSTMQEQAAESEAALKSEISDSAPVLKSGPGAKPLEADTFQVEVAPLQSVLIDPDQIFIFRRIMINQKIYRQGFIVKIQSFLNHLVDIHFRRQPMAAFSRLRLRVLDRDTEINSINAGVSEGAPQFILNRIFPKPFAFLHATLTSAQIPRSAGRSTLNIMMVFLAGVFLAGLLAIYYSTRTIVDLSKRRSRFVSSVTHELKTPLTNIRMYIEMLSQGMARDREREEAYLKIIDSEGARLTRLINNVLDLSKLEQKQRSVDLKPGTFEEVIREVEQVMAEKLKQDGFVLSTRPFQVDPFYYDREVMIQILINLIENSVKFGKWSDKKMIFIKVAAGDHQVDIRVSDSGPGIEPRALKKVFDEFFRVDNALSKKTRGTGIGLALVRKFVILMGGTVSAANNDGPGCTITISLPKKASV